MATIQDRASGHQPGPITKDTAAFHTRLEELVDEVIGRARRFEKDCEYYASLEHDFKEGSDSYQWGLSDGIKKGTLDTKRSILGRLPLFVYNGLTHGGLPGNQPPAKANDLLCGSRYYFSGLFVQYCGLNGLGTVLDLVERDTVTYDSEETRRQATQLLAYRSEVIAWLEGS